MRTRAAIAGSSSPTQGPAATTARSQSRDSTLPPHPGAGGGLFDRGHPGVLANLHTCFAGQPGEVGQRLTAAQVPGPGVEEQPVLAADGELRKPPVYLFHGQLGDILAQPAQRLPAGQRLVLRPEAANRDQLAGLEVDRAAGALVPFPPLGGRPRHQLDVDFVRVVGAPDHLGDIGARRLRVGDLAALDQGHLVSAPAQLERRGHAEDSRPCDADFHALKFAPGCGWFKPRFPGGIWRSVSLASPGLRLPLPRSRAGAAIPRRTAAARQRGSGTSLPPGWSG